VTCRSTTHVLGLNITIVKKTMCCLTELLFFLLASNAHSGSPTGTRKWCPWVAALPAPPARGLPRLLKLLAVVKAVVLYTVAYNPIKVCHFCGRKILHV